MKQESKPVLFFVERLAPEVHQRLEREIEARFATSIAENDILDQVSDVDAIVIRTKGRITRRIIEAAPRLKVIGRHGVGVDHIDVEAAQERGIRIVNTPHATTQAVAEFTILLIQSVMRKLISLDLCVRNKGNWRDFLSLTGAELYGKRLGIVGIGNIGLRVGQIAQCGFGMKIAYFDYKNRQLPIGSIEGQAMTLAELFKCCDVISLHLPATPSTHHLVNSELLAIAKPGTVIVNTGRGCLVDEEALLDGIDAGIIGGAGLDVMEVEPSENRRLLECERVVLSPHAASFTHESFFKMAEVVDDVLRVLSGTEPKYSVI